VSVVSPERVFARSCAAALQSGSHTYPDCLDALTPEAMLDCTHSMHSVVQSRQDHVPARRIAMLPCAGMRAARIACLCLCIQPIRTADLMCLQASPRGFPECRPHYCTIISRARAHTHTHTHTHTHLFLQTHPPHPPPQQVIVLASRLCPEGMEGTMYALIMSINNLGGERGGPYAICLTHVIATLTKKGTASLSKPHFLSPPPPPYLPAPSPAPLPRPDLIQASSARR